MKYLYEVTWVQKDHEPLSGPSKTPCGVWRYGGVLCQRETASGAVVGSFTGVLQSLFSLPGVTASPRNSSHISAWNAPTASTTLSNDNEGWWEESSLRGNLKGQQGPIGKKVRTEQLQNSNRKEHMGGRLSWNSHPSVTLLLLLLLRFFPFPTAQVSQSEKKNHDVLRKRKFSSPSSCETSLLSNT